MPNSAPDVYVEEHKVIITPGGMASRAWPVYWGAVWAGALSALALALIFGLVGTALGAHQVGKKAVNLHDMSFWGLVFSVAGAFFSFVLAGWVASSIAGLRWRPSAQPVSSGRGTAASRVHRCGPPRRLWAPTPMLRQLPAIRPLVPSQPS